MARYFFRFAYSPGVPGESVDLLAGAPVREGSKLESMLHWGIARFQRTEFTAPYFIQEYTRAAVAREVPWLSTTEISNTLRGLFERDHLERREIDEPHSDWFTASGEQEHPRERKWKRELGIAQTAPPAATGELQPARSFEEDLARLRERLNIRIGDRLTVEQAEAYLPEETKIRRKWGRNF